MEAVLVLCTILALVVARPGNSFRRYQSTSCKSVVSLDHHVVARNVVGKYYTNTWVPIMVRGFGGLDLAAASKRLDVYHALSIDLLSCRPFLDRYKA